MSWNDPCMECGKPRYSCDCSIEPYTEEQLKRWEKERIEKERLKKEVCEVKGHDWEYTFIIYVCKRCKETTEY